MKRTVLPVVLVLVLASWVSADPLVIDFTEAGSKLTSIFVDMTNSNTGLNGMEVLGGPNSGQKFDGLLWADMSSLSGATINTATFHVAQDGWGWGGADDVELHRFTSTQDWVQGSNVGADWSNRWVNDNGAGARMMDWDTFAGAGTDWSGTYHTWMSGAAPWTGYIDAVVYDCQSIPAGTAGVDFDMKLLVQQWADGTYANNGWVMYAQFGMNASAAHLSTPTLTIDYTPIPEPGTLLLTGTGILGMIGWIRRRRCK